MLPPGFFKGGGFIQIYLERFALSGTAHQTGYYTLTPVTVAGCSRTFDCLIQSGSAVPLQRLEKNRPASPLRDTFPAD